MKCHKRHWQANEFGNYFVKLFITSKTVIFVKNISKSGGDVACGRESFLRGHFALRYMYQSYAPYNFQDLKDRKKKSQSILKTRGEYAIKIFLFVTDPNYDRTLDMFGFPV